MTFLSWRKDYEVGVAQIDAEHRSLFALINEFHDAYARGDSRRQIPQVLNRLVAYAEEHFQHEEKLMSDSEYPQLDRHREQHHVLVTSIFAINEKFAAEPVKVSAEVIQFIRKWLIDHILKDDMDIGDYLRRKANRAKQARQDEPGEKSKEKATPGSAKKPASGDAE